MDILSEIGAAVAEVGREAREHPAGAIVFVFLALEFVLVYSIL